jgi:carbamoyl-phosphate synthase large subunit
LKNITVLVTGSTAPGYVSIARALRLSKSYKIRIIATDFRENISSRFFSDKSYVLTHNYHPEFPQALLEICEKENVDVVLPIRTDDQLPICNNLEAFRNSGVEPALVVTDSELLDTILNKRRLMEYCQNVIGIRTSTFSYASDSESLTRIVESFGYPEAPVVIKPSYSKGSRGFRILNEQVDRHKLFFEEKPYGVYSTLNRVLEEIGNEFPELIVMEYLPGTEYTIDVLCRKGRTFAILPRQRSGMTKGITTSGVLIEDTNKASIRDYSKRIVEGFGLSYNAGLQMKENIEGIPLLLEINPRLQGTTIMSVQGGVNIPEMMVQMALREFDYEYEPEIKWGLKMERVWLELFEHEERCWSIEE